MRHHPQARPAHAHLPPPPQFGSNAINYAKPVGDFAANCAAFKNKDCANTDSACGLYFRHTSTCPTAPTCADGYYYSGRGSDWLALPRDAVKGIESIYADEDGARDKKVAGKLFKYAWEDGLICKGGSDHASKLDPDTYALVINAPSYRDQHQMVRAARAGCQRMPLAPPGRRRPHASLRSPAALTLTLTPCSLPPSRTAHPRPEDG